MEQLDSIATAFILKPNEGLEFYNVIGLEYLFEKAAYKITLNSEPIDPIYQFEKSADRYIKDGFPDSIFKYKRLLPQNVISNVLYFSSKN